MGLILNKTIQKLMAGYPTVADKYDVQGGLLGGSNAAQYGDVLCYSSAQGTYEKKTISAATDVAGINIAQNVKLTTVWPGGVVEVKVGEAVNLCNKGYIAVKCANNIATNPSEGAVAYVNADGLFTTSSSSTFDIGAKFTGVYEGTNDATHGYVAEIVLK